MVLFQVVFETVYGNNRTETVVMNVESVLGLSILDKQNIVYFISFCFGRAVTTVFPRFLLSKALKQISPNLPKAIPNSFHLLNNFLNVLSVLLINMLNQIDPLLHELTFLSSLIHVLDVLLNVPTDEDIL